MMIMMMMRMMIMAVAMVTLSTWNLCDAFTVLPFSATTSTTHASRSIIRNSLMTANKNKNNNIGLLFSSSSSNNSEGGEEFPPLSDEEIETLLANIPVYAVTEANTEDGGLVLLTEPNNENSIAYFFLSPETANTVFQPLKEQAAASSDSDIAAADWDVTSFSLGMLWFEVLQPGIVNGIEYRLVPSSQELVQARSIVEQTALETGNTRPPNVFRTECNEIPIFMDTNLRLNDASGKERVPMYFGLQDLLDSCQQLPSNTKDAGEAYQPSINVAELRSLLGQMGQSSTVDFSKILLVPSSPSSSSSSSSSSSEPPKQQQQRSQSKGKGAEDDIILPNYDTEETTRPVTPITPSMATDSWDD